MKADTIHSETHSALAPTRRYIYIYDNSFDSTLELGCPSRKVRKRAHTWFSFPSANPLPSQGSHLTARPGSSCPPGERHLPVCRVPPEVRLREGEFGGRRRRSTEVDHLDRNRLERVETGRVGEKTEFGWE